MANEMLLQSAPLIPLVAIAYGLSDVIFAPPNPGAASSGGAQSASQGVFLLTDSFALNPALFGASTPAMAVSSSPLPYLSLAYIALAKLYAPGRAELPDAATLKGWRFTYNALFCVFSAVVCALEGWALWGSGGVFGALYWRGGGSGGGEAASCSAAFANSAFAEAAKMFYYSKYVEWMDTAWIVLGGKRPGFLHLFHHIGTHQDPSLHACCRSLKAVLAAHPAVRALPRRRAAGDLPFPAAQLERRRRR